MKKEYYLYVGGQKVKVSEDIYKVYWREREHEKYLEQVDRKNHLLFFRPWIRMDILQIISLMKVLMSKILWSVWYCYNEKRGEILDFKLFYKYFVFVDKGNFDIKKVLKRYIDVNVFVDIVCVSEK